MSLVGIGTKDVAELNRLLLSHSLTTYT